jgi:hypothetical protein
MDLVRRVINVTDEQLLAMLAQSALRHLDLNSHAVAGPDIPTLPLEDFIRALDGPEILVFRRGIIGGAVHVKEEVRRVEAADVESDRLGNTEYSAVSCEGIDGGSDLNCVSGRCNFKE